MSSRLKIAVCWAGACGGCDVALLDLGERLLELTEVADLVYWPVALDLKHDDLKAFGPGEIDIGIFNGAVRTSAQAEDARLLRERSKVLVAFGSCAALGGIPGLANLSSREDLLETVYRETASTDNPDGVLPAECTEVGGHGLELPVFHETVKALGHEVEVDLVVPGCPPPEPQVEQTLELILALAGGAAPPPPGTVLASDRALCDECARNQTRPSLEGLAGRLQRIETIHRPHEVLADPERCFLDQGVICQGLVTRAGCGGTCLGVNMPCRGCFGPPPGVYDPGADALSALGSLVAPPNEDDLPQPQRLRPVRSIRDVAGTFYRFSLPSSIVFRRVAERSKG